MDPPELQAASEQSSLPLSCLPCTLTAVDISIVAYIATIVWSSPAALVRIALWLSITKAKRRVFDSLMRIGDQDSMGLELFLDVVPFCVMFSEKSGLAC